MATVAPSLVWLGPKEKARSAVSEQRLALLTLAAILALGCAIRFVGLASAPLHNNELNHYYVARSLRSGGLPLLPSGEWYGRGLEFSRIVALGLGTLRPAELAVRLPAAVFGCLALLMFAIIAWRMARPYAALYATMLFAIFPPFVEVSRFGRFYTLQLLVGLVAMFAGWQALRDRPVKKRDKWRLAREWGWMLLAGIALAFAARLQVVTLSIVLGLAAATGVRSVAHVRATGWRVLAGSMPVQVLLLSILGAVVTLLIVPDLPEQLAIRMRSVPVWARSGGENVPSYFVFLLGSLPVLAVGGGAALFWMFRRYGAMGMFLALWFLVPFVVHSQLPWRAGRFILLAVPALILAVAIAGADLLGAFVRAVREGLARLRLSPATAGAISSLAAVILAIAAITPIPGVRIAGWLRNDESAGWRESLEIVRSLPGVASIPLGHSLPLPALHYWGGLDFTINETLREQWLSREEKRNVLGVDEPDGYAWLPMGAPDMYTGHPVLSTVDAIRSKFAATGQVLIGLHSDAPLLGIDAQLRQTLRAEATELCKGRCGPMLLYHWTFGPVAAPEPAEGGT